MKCALFTYVYTEHDARYNDIYFKYVLPIHNLYMNIYCV